jgi:fatty acid synthase subunit beta
MVQMNICALFAVSRSSKSARIAHFGGTKATRQRYMDIPYETTGKDGTTKTLLLFAGTDIRTSKYAFSHPTGLLFATQSHKSPFLPPRKRHSRAYARKALFRAGAPFAGHSLGEHSALASIADVLAISALADAIFYWRGVLRSEPMGATRKTALTALRALLIPAVFRRA